MTALAHAEIYESQIAPLVKQVFDICEAEGLPMLAMFAVPQDAETEKIFQTRVAGNSDSLSNLMKSLFWITDDFSNLMQLISIAARINAFRDLMSGVSLDLEEPPSSLFPPGHG